jgi:hypothetical protein
MLKKFLTEQPVGFKFLKIKDNLNVQWRESYLTTDKIISFYLAKDEKVLRSEATKNGISFDRVTEINEVHDGSDFSGDDLSRGVEKL